MKKKYIKPYLELITYESSDLLHSSGKPGHGYGDGNHDHDGPPGHRKDSYEDEDDSSWNGWS